jgi:hypothetical protein
MTSFKDGPETLSAGNTLATIGFRRSMATAGDAQDAAPAVYALFVLFTPARKPPKMSAGREWWRKIRFW